MEQRCAAVILVLVKHEGEDKMPSYMQISQELSAVGLPTSPTQAGSFVNVAAKKGWVDLRYRMATPLGVAGAAAVFPHYDGRFESIAADVHGVQNGNLGSQSWPVMKTTSGL